MAALAALAITTAPSDIESASYSDFTDDFPKIQCCHCMPKFDSRCSANSVSGGNPTPQGSPSDSDEDLSPGTTPRKPLEINTSLDGMHDKLGIPKNSISRLSRKLRSYTATVVPFTPSPMSITRSSPINRSPTRSYGSSVGGEGWDSMILLELTDGLRTVLKISSIHIQEKELLDELLGSILEDEKLPSRAIELAVISHSRFDKLLGALLDSKQILEEVDDGLQSILNKAGLLRYKWQRRFLKKYFDLDEVRLNEMRANRLHDMTLIAGDKDGQKWNVDKRNPIDEMEGDLSFEPGAWWVDLCSAFRDGIVGNATENVTNGHYGVTALPMVTGIEEEGQGGTVKLIKKGGKKDIYLNLIKQVGRQIRVLRGYTLRSEHAPLAGIRYDGLYTIKQYGHKLCPETNTYRLELTLERVAGQRPIDELLDIPRPSELDDWQYYNRVLAEDIRAKKGDVVYSNWKEKEEEEEREREQWRQWHDFKRQNSQVGWLSRS